MAQKSIKDVIQNSSCYIINAGEMLSETSDVMVEDEDGKVVLDVKSAVKIAQTLWDGFKETAEECAGQKIEVRLPEGYLGMVISAALAALGIKL